MEHGSATKKAIAIDDIKCRHDKMSGRSPVLFSSHAARSVHVLAAALSRPTESLCRLYIHTPMPRYHLDILGTIMF